MPTFRTDNSGLTRDEWRQVQTGLRTRGFDPGPVDGILGPRTTAAILAFKRHLGLRLRAYIGPLTWGALTGGELPAPSEPLPWLREAGRLMGKHEAINNAELKAWLASDGHALGDPAKLPWCGDFVETAIRLALKNEPVPGNPYWALNWRGFGEACGEVRGAVVSITRDGGGHVGFAVGKDASRIYVLGGNQSNRVSVAPIDRSRFVAASWRWPASTTAAQVPLPQMSGGTTVNMFA